MRPTLGIAVVVSTLAGCSLLRPRAHHATCTNELVFPIIDTVVALAGITLGAALVSDGRPTIAVTAGGFATIAGASAGYGYTKVSRCAAAK